MTKARQLELDLEAIRAVGSRAVNDERVPPFVREWMEKTLAAVPGLLQRVVADPDAVARWRDKWLLTPGRHLLQAAEAAGMSPRLCTRRAEVSTQRVRHKPNKT